jgi:hypothetical protein
MTFFPRTTVGGLSVPRMIIGCNWFLGFSHATVSKDQLIRDSVANPKAIADIVEVFLEYGIDAVLAMVDIPALAAGLKEAEDRTGKRIIRISTPALPIGPETPSKGLDMGEVERILDKHQKIGADFLMPHQCTTDALLDRCTREIRHMATVSRMVRERGMIPGLSTHMPESIIYSDETGLDVETYISIYNAMGFLMQLEVDWTQRIILDAKKPVLTIKPMAAGQIRPLQGLTFVWNTIRDQDMVSVGTMSPGEARELIEMSLSILERRESGLGLQETRSKASVMKG